MDMKQVGGQIAALRRGKGLTQQQLGERLGITFQAVSKWERGETLPDVALLPELAEVLETSVDAILSGGRAAAGYRGRITVAQMAEGLNALRRMGEALGRDSLIYRSAVEGINTAMNTSIEDAFADDNVFECFLAEAVIQQIMAGRWVDVTDVRTAFRCEKWRDVTLDYCRRYGLR